MSRYKIASIEEYSAAIEKDILDIVSWRNEEIKNPDGMSPDLIEESFVAALKQEILNTITYCDPEFMSKWLSVFKESDQSEQTFTPYNNWYSDIIISPIKAKRSILELYQKSPEQVNGILKALVERTPKFVKEVQEEINKTVSQNDR